jgi:hypothetical protein
MSEMDVRPQDVDDDERDRVETSELDIEAPEADVAEQRRLVQAAEDQRDQTPFEVDPADAAEQSRVVDLDEDDYR